MFAINDPEVVAEITKVHEEYESALADNEVETLTRLFWSSPLALRFGVRENLYGVDEIDAFRKSRPPLGLDRTVENRQIVVFGPECAIVTLEFHRRQHHGRQSQVWWKFPEGWKVVSAHVSFMYETYADQAAALTGLAIPVQSAHGVAQNLERSGRIAASLLDAPLTEGTLSAPRFEP